MVYTSSGVVVLCKHGMGDRAKMKSGIKEMQDSTCSISSDQTTRIIFLSISSM
jgi:hypothetical protein